MALIAKLPFLFGSKMGAAVDFGTRMAAIELAPRLSHLTAYTNTPRAPFELRRTLATAARKDYDAVVIGAGPGGLTCVSNLLDQGLSKVAMIDDGFSAGRINERYREVPSNTKTTMFEKWATHTEAFKSALEKAPSGNAYEKMLTFNQDKGCQLGDAVNVAQLLSDGLRKDSRVDSMKTRVHEIKRANGTWQIPKLGLNAQRVVLAVGSHPRPNSLADRYPHISPLDLDTTLKPSALKDAVPRGSRVAVVGSSHSAILALKNLQELPEVEVVNFYRSKLLYAEYKDGWILYDNTGLKGVAATWAREVLAGEKPPANLRRINLKQDNRSEQQIYDEELKNCTHLVSAIGYDINALPRIVVDEVTVEPEFDPLTGRFRKAKGGKELLPGLFGAGIAYPERVTDKAGNVESAVGWFKFGKAVKKWSPEWVANP